MADYGALQILLHPDEYHRLYNCSLYSVDDIPLEVRRHPVLGTVYVVLFLVFETCHILCLPVLWTKMQHSSCYKIMFYMSVLDVTGLPVIALGSGIFMFLGVVFCSAPTLLYALALPMPIWWYCETMAAILLAFNRCVETISSYWGERLFGGKKTWLWLVIPTLYGIEHLVFSKTIVFSGVIGCWHFNPHLGYLEDTEDN
ncbi:Protein SRT-59, partial [Aphelenchoides avenae]